MAYFDGIDTVAVATFGVYSEFYGLGEEADIAKLYVSFGYLEDEPPPGYRTHGMPKMPYIPTIPVVKT